MMVSLEHLFQSWDQFKRGKRKRKDIQIFERNLEDRIFDLHDQLATLQYRPDNYDHFFITDPKQRNISKASVRDRLVHQMLYNVLSPIFDPKFIFHSLSSRLGKGTHIGVVLLQKMIRKAGHNGKKPCYALKLDVKRFFDTIDQSILKRLIRKTIEDEKTLHVIDLVIDSFNKEIGIPLGNVTSQLFANIYLNELDDFIKQQLREKFYLRYCDDFIILSKDSSHLESLISIIQEFLFQHLKLELHPKKVIIRKLSQGIDFIGYVLFEHHILLRTKTKRRMKKRLKKAYDGYLSGTLDTSAMDQRLQSYLGILSHANEHSLSQALKNAYWVRKHKTEKIFDRLRRC